MLETTLNTAFQPGTNRKGEMVTADWRFLLPSLEMDRIACLGLPPLAAIELLSRMCNEVWIFERNKQARQQFGRLVEKRGLDNVLAYPQSHITDQVTPRSSVDLVFAAHGKAVRQLIADGEALPLLSRIMRPGAVLFFRLNGILDRGAGRKASRLFSQDGFCEPQEFYIAPALGRMRMAIPLKDKKLRSFFTRGRFSHRAVKEKLLRTYGKLLGDYPRVIISRRSKIGFNSTPPEYLADMCKTAELDPAQYRCGMAAGGRYNAKKIVFYLFKADTNEPEFVVKLTRSPEFNYRLENEYQTLRQLHDRQLLSSGTFPAPLFLEHHCGLAVVGQTIVKGEPFGKVSAATPDCRFMSATVTLLTDLAVRTLDRKAVNGKIVSENLGKLLSNFLEIYDISRSSESFLKEQVASLSTDEGFPLIFQHGDAGSWNVLITRSGGIGFVDWEAGENQGLPLWDLFYFMKTYGVLIARKEGVFDSNKAFAENFLHETPIGSKLISVTGQYCQQVGLHSRFVEPLFYTCWMHRALKEATRLQSGSMDSGHYINLIKLAIIERNSPVLKRLFSL